MKAVRRLLFAIGAFAVVALSSGILILLDALAVPLRWVNVRALAALAAVHASEVEGAK